LGGRAAVISITRMLNQGLLLISPILLVRLLSVEAFGRYREFLLYASVLITFANFTLSKSLLHFAPHRPEHRQRFVDQTLLLTFASSAIALGTVAVLNALFDGALVGEQMLPIALYVGLFVNFDFWEHLWLSQRRIGAVFAYTTMRLVARLTVVVIAAALSGDPNVIIWSLVVLEGVRFTVAFAVWWRRREPYRSELPGSWREQLRFCLPSGTASVLVTVNKSMGSLFITKLLGPVALAHYTIGTYVQPIITVLRDSLSDVLLPEMSAEQRAGTNDPLFLWRHMTVLAAILLIGALVVLERFAEILIVTIFTAEYQAAVLIFQIYLLVLAREVMDFAVPLRAINRTAPIMHSNTLSIVLNAILLAVLLPTIGVAGAAIAFVVSRVVEGFYLSRQMARAYSLRVRDLARWGDLSKVVLAAALASVTLYGDYLTDALGLIGVLLHGGVFLIAYVALLVLFRVPEAAMLLSRLQRLPRALHSRT